jgi:DNA ligase (NAD+)
MDPVQLAGTVVKRASLHNADVMAELDLHIGDMVYVEKGGEIIPKVVGVDKEQRTEGLQRVEFIKTCPSAVRSLCVSRARLPTTVPTTRHVLRR